MTLRRNRRGNLLRQCLIVIGDVVSSEAEALRLNLGVMHAQSTS